MYKSTAVPAISFVLAYGCSCHSIRGCMGTVYFEDARTFVAHCMRSLCLAGLIVPLFVSCSPVIRFICVIVQMGVGARGLARGGVIAFR